MLTMYNAAQVVGLVVAMALSVEGVMAATREACPCSNTSLCAPLTTPMPEKEVFAFQVSKDNWVNYDWTRVTTIALFGGLDPKLLCHAHERGVRLVWLANIAVDLLTNSTAVSEYISATVNNVEATFTDGVNIDFESPIAANDTVTYNALTSFVSNITAALRYKNPHAQVTFDVAWNPTGVDGRNYPYKEIAEICDFVVIMSYDTRSQVPGGPPCYAGPNTPLSAPLTGIEQYLQLLAGDRAAAAKRLVLGLPWYGYFYTCINTTNLTTQVCQIKSVPFRGVPCSDAAGGQMAFVDILKITHGITPGWKLTTPLITSPESYVTFNAVNHQAPAEIVKFYYDDPTTLAQKYAVAKSYALRGLSMWNVDMLPNDVSGPLARERVMMWQAMDAFFG